MQKTVEYHDASDRKYPAPVYIVIALDRNGVCNPTTIEWCMTASHDPRLVAVSIGVNRYLVECVRSAGEFILVLPSGTMAKEALFFGSNSGRTMNKLKEAKSGTQVASFVDCLLLSEAVANFECRVQSEFTTGDHVIFIGEVVASHMNTEADVVRLFNHGPGRGMGPVSTADGPDL